MITRQLARSDRCHQRGETSMDLTEASWCLGLCGLRASAAHLFLTVSDRRLAERCPHLGRLRPVTLLQKLRRCPYHWFDSRFDKHSALNVREPWDTIMAGDIASTALDLLDRYVRAPEKPELQPWRFKLAALASLTLALKYHDDDPLNMVGDAKELALRH